MWDFRFGKAVGIVMQTLPFVVLRLAVFVGIGVAYLIAFGTGGVLGYGFGRVFSAGGEAGAMWGGVIGIGLASLGLYLAREYILYLVKAAHIAVLVEIYDGHTIPAGKDQLSHGATYVKTHFVQSSVLFGVDQLIKGVLRAFFRTINFFTAFLPVPALESLIRLAEHIVRLSLTYVDEIILAYLIRTRTDNPWASARDGLVLYAQNYKHFLKNAAWLAVFLWLLSALIFLALLGPMAALLLMMPGELSGWGFALAFIFAWGLKAAVLEPVAIAALMQVYFATIAGQTPDPEWVAKLENLSGKFRDLAGKAGRWSPRPGPAAGS